MTGGLEQQLISLGAELELPPAPDIAAAVISRLPERRARRGRPAIRTLAVALAVALMLAGAAMAVPSSRHAILHLLGLRGVSIERVSRLPPLPAGAGVRLGLGQRVPLARARDAAGFTALLPPRLTAAYLDKDVPGGRLSLLTGSVLIMELRGTATPFIFKVIGPGTHAQITRVNGTPGVYLSGAAHEVIFEEPTGQIQTDRVRLAGNVLIWQQGPLTIRIEGTHTLGQALALARALR
jgi:hypothetical protein